MKTYLLSLLLVSLFAVTLSLDCYVCEGGLCNDPFIAIGVSDTCPSSINPYLFCQKEIDSSGTVRRSCATTCAGGCYGGTCKYCCSSNLCNGGTRVTTSLVAMVVALLAAFLFSRQ